MQPSFVESSSCWSWQSQKLKSMCSRGFPCDDTLDLSFLLMDHGRMKTPASPLATWPFGIEAQATSEGLLLKPRRKPREGWAKAFRDARKSRADELTTARQIQNQFDAEEWQW